MAIQKLKSLSNGYGDDRYAPIVNAFESIGQGLSRYQENQNERLRQLAEQQNKMEQLKKLEDYYESKGLPRQLAHQPEFVQKESYKSHLRPKSLGEAISEYFVGNQHPMAGVASSAFGQKNTNEPIPQIIRGANNEPVGVQIGSQLVSVDQISPETLQSLEMLEQQNAQNDQQESTFGTKAGNFLTGLGTRAAGLATGGDIVSAGVGGLNALSNLIPTQEGREAEKKKWAERLKNIDPQTLSELAQEGAFNDLANPEEVREAVRNLSPTTETFQKGLEKATKGTAAEKFVSPKNESDQWYKDIGEVASLLSRPGKTIADTATNVLKGAGAAVGGDLAGWLTKKATGNETAGNVVKNGSYVLYSMFPGLPSTLANKAYDQFREKVIKPAAEKGYAVDIAKFNPKINEIKKEIEDTFKYNTSGARQQLETEVNKIQQYMAPNGTVNPAQLWSNAKTMNSPKYRNKIDQQAQGIYQKIIDVQKDALVDFGNEFSPEAGNLLNKADDFYRTSHDIKKSFEGIKSLMSPRNYGAGAAIYLMGAFPTLIKVGAGTAAAKFMTKMLQSPAVRQEITQLIKAGSTNNAVLVNKAMSRFNSQTENQLKKLPEKDQAQVREFIKLATAEMMKEKSK